MGLALAFNSAASFELGPGALYSAALAMDSSDAPGHPRADECSTDECVVCAERDCPYREPLHYHHDGCPACWSAERACPRNDALHFVPLSQCPSCGEMEVQAATHDEAREHALAFAATRKAGGLRIRLVGGLWAPNAEPSSETYAWLRRTLPPDVRVETRGLPYEGGLIILRR